MSSDSETSSVQAKPREMTVDEYSELLAKWQHAYYAWNTSCVTYHNMMMLNSLAQQIPILTTTTTALPTNRSPPFDPLAEIRNARLKVASVWRRFLAEAIDFLILHIFKILMIFVLANYLHLIDETHLSLSYMVSSILYEDSLSFPLELLCVELAYLVICIAFESFCLTRYAATPGKRLLRLRVLKCNHLQIQENGDVAIEPGTILNSGAALIRSSFKTLTSTFLFPTVIIALLTSQNRQTSYDVAASAVVVELERRES